MWWPWPSGNLDCLILGHVRLLECDLFVTKAVIYLGHMIFFNHCKWRSGPCHMSSNNGYTSFSSLHWKEWMQHLPCSRRASWNLEKWAKLAKSAIGITVIGSALSRLFQYHIWDVEILNSLSIALVSLSYYLVRKVINVWGIQQTLGVCSWSYTVGPLLRLEGAHWLVEWQVWEEASSNSTSK